MPRQARIKSESGIYHIMLRGINRQQIFEETEDYCKFLDISHRTVPCATNDIFSPADKRNAERQGVPTYVATPLGTLRKYDPSNGIDIVLFDDIPFDPKHPGRKY